MGINAYSRHLSAILTVLVMICSLIKSLTKSQEDIMNTQEIWLRMSQVNRLSPSKALKIINELTLLGKANKNILLEQGLNELQCLQFLHFSSSRLMYAIRWLENKENQLIRFCDPQYPFLLKQISNPPLVLFVVGNTRLITETQIAVVGSRQVTDYGRKWTELFVNEFVKYGFTVTSGLALGVDGMSHSAALKAGGHTIAILGSGLANIYPQQHITLAKQIKETGTLVSEYLPDTPPLPKQFPRRNRIISGLSKAVVVIEAGLKSGSLITARYAIEQNRDLFTLPAPLGNPAFSGNHWLTQQGAYLLADPEDIKHHIEGSLNWLLSTPAMENTVGKVIQRTNPVENKILSVIGYQPIPIDIIAEQLDLPITELLSILTELEIEGVITSASGGYIKLS